MKDMINGYIKSCEAAKERITALTAQRNLLRKKGDDAAIAELCLERRIKLLYDEHHDMKEIIDHLNSISRRTEGYVKT